MKINKPALILTVLALLALYVSQEFMATNYLFVSFKDPGNQGIFYAMSNDGLQWEALNASNPVSKPSKGISRTRDPFVTRDPKKGYHLVFTCGGKPFSFGHAYSEDLIHWDNFKKVPVFENSDSLLNVWAPELIYDKINSEWLVYWSSTIAGDFKETQGLIENGKNHRIYAIKTKDFKAFSEPFIFFEPGYPVIDASIIEHNDMFVMFYKDERRWPLKKQLRYATSGSLYGPWKEFGDTLTEPWTEGPSAIGIDRDVYLYYDKYSTPQQMQVMKSADLKHWENISEKASFPALFKHGSFLKLTRKESRSIKAYFAKSE